jgi:hypothetical protein
MTATSGNMEADSDPLKLWYLCKNYSLVQAALLVAGHDPASFEDVEQLTWEERPRGYQAAKNALVQHMKSSWGFGNEIQLDRRSGGGIDIHQSTVSFDQMRDWLVERGQTNGFFGREQAASAGVPDYLNRHHPRYAPKLAAAVRAWEAVDDEAVARTGRSPRKLLYAWLEERATEFDLNLSNGQPNRTGIEEVAKVANWRPEGGAPKTPGKS